MPDPNRKAAGSTWLLLFFLTLSTCSIADNTDRIADALERAYPKGEAR